MKQITAFLCDIDGCCDIFYFKETHTAEFRARVRNYMKETSRSADAVAFHLMTARVDDRLDQINKKWNKSNTAKVILNTTMTQFYENNPKLKAKTTLHPKLAADDFRLKDQQGRFSMPTRKGKLHLLLLKMHQLAHQHPNDEINIIFFDDRLREIVNNDANESGYEEMHDAIEILYQYPQLVPKNISFKATILDNYTQTLQAYRTEPVAGTGKPMTTQEIAKAFVISDQLINLKKSLGKSQQRCNMTGEYHRYELTQQKKWLQLNADETLTDLLKACGCTSNMVVNNVGDAILQCLGPQQTNRIHDFLLEHVRAMSTAPHSTENTGKSVSPPPRA